VNDLLRDVITKPFASAKPTRKAYWRTFLPCKVLFFIGRCTAFSFPTRFPFRLLWKSHHFVNLALFSAPFPGDEERREKRRRRREEKEEREKESKGREERRRREKRERKKRRERERERKREKKKTKKKKKKKREKKK